MEHLLDGQAFGQRNRIEDRLARLQKLHHVLHRRAGLDLVFAGLQRLVVEIGLRDETEDARIGDDVAALETAGDLAHAGAAPDDEVLVCLQRTRLLVLMHGIVDRAGRSECRKDDDGHHEIQENHRLAARLARPLRGLWHFFRAQCLVCRFRNDRPVARVFIAAELRRAVIV
ncbi:hypothetical protein D9M72_457860 [compost metagenome]